MNNVTLFNRSPLERIKPAELSRWLLSRGISSITTDDIAALLGIPKNQVSPRLAAPKKRGEIVLLANRLWAPVPPEYMIWGAPPALDFIDDLMRHLNVDYYVGWLSAAELLGASHHAPQVFQVAVSHVRRARIIGRSRLQFYQRDHIHLAARIKIESKSANVPVSSRETTLLDIASDIGFVGGIDNAANLIMELCETTVPDPKTLASLAAHYPSSAIRRLGYIMDHFTDVSAPAQLKAISDNRNTSISLLDPQSANTGKIDKIWQLKINREVNPDL